MTSVTSPKPDGHWMLHEMEEQPATLAATLAAYVEGDRFRAEPCAPVREWLRRVPGLGDEIVFVASGSSRHAAMVAELEIEELSGIGVDVEYASEYIYRSAGSLKRAATVVVSQSGETVDTLLALRKANQAARGTLAISNVPDSAMAREASASFPVQAGRERAVPATKSFTGQLLNLYLLALLAAESRQTMGAEEIAERLHELEQLPAQVAAQLPQWKSAAARAADMFRETRSFLFLGRGVHYPIAREGALKLKESAYLHAEGYPSGELKHGPNALVSEETALVMLLTVDHADAASVERYGKSLQLLGDMREQGARILAIANAGDTEVASLATMTIAVEPASEYVLPMTEVIPLQLLAYSLAVRRGINVDHPRNLSKAVLVE